MGQYNHSIGVRFRVMQHKKTLLALAGFDDGREPQPKEFRQLEVRCWKRQASGFSLRISRKECRLANTVIVATLENQLRGLPRCLEDKTLGSQCRGPELSHWLKD